MYHTCIGNIAVFLCCKPIPVGQKDSFKGCFLQTADTCLPYLDLHIPVIIPVIQNHDHLFIIGETAIAQALIIIPEELQGAFPKESVFFMDPDHHLVEINQALIFPSPWISTTVIRICKATDSCLIAIIYGRRSRPCHLNGHCFSHNCRIDP